MIELVISDFLFNMHMVRIFYLHIIIIIIICFYILRRIPASLKLNYLLLFKRIKGKKKLVIISVKSLAVAFLASLSRDFKQDCKNAEGSRSIVKTQKVLRHPSAS